MLSSIHNGLRDPIKTISDGSYVRLYFVELAYSASKVSASTGASRTASWLSFLYRFYVFVVYACAKPTFSTLSSDSSKSQISEMVSTVEGLNKLERLLLYLQLPSTHMQGDPLRQ